jgi:hypothetical protein
MSSVFQNIDPPPPSRPGECVPPPLVRGEDTPLGGEGGGGSIFWNTTGKALYSTYVSTLWMKGFLIRSLQEIEHVIVGSCQQEGLAVDVQQRAHVQVLQDNEHKNSASRFHR